VYLKKKEGEQSAARQKEEGELQKKFSSERFKFNK